jgi:hypothetical protein
MRELNEVFNLIASMSPGALVALVLLAAFALAGYAIYAVLTVARGRG